MNPDDFEKQLQRQPLSPPPAAWREEILTAARAKIPNKQAPREANVLGWRTFLSRIPLAWGAVAALWLLIIGVNSLVSDGNGTVAAKGPVGRPMMTAWSAQRIQASLLASGSPDLPEIAPPRETPPAPPRPRSDRRRDDGMGDLNATAKRLTFV